MRGDFKNFSWRRKKDFIEGRGKSDPPWGECGLHREKEEGGKGEELQKGRGGKGKKGIDSNPTQLIRGGKKEGRGRKSLETPTTPFGGGRREAVLVHIARWGVNYRR